MTEAAPTVTAKSVAICGSSESAERTIDWLAKPARASSTMARVWDGKGIDCEGASTACPLEKAGALYPSFAAGAHALARTTHSGGACGPGLSTSYIDSKSSAGLCTARSQASRNQMIENRYQPAEIEARI